MMITLGVIHAGEAEHAAQLIGGNDHGAALGRGASNRLREGGRTRGMKGDIAFHLLHDLVNVSVEDGHGTETLEHVERLCSIGSSPAPFRINLPQRHVREYHDGRTGGKGREVLFQPVELVRAEGAQALIGLAKDVDQPDEVNALLVEAVPAIAERTLAETLQ